MSPIYPKGWKPLVSEMNFTMPSPSPLRFRLSSWDRSQTWTFTPQEAADIIGGFIDREVKEKQMEPKCNCRADLNLYRVISAGERYQVKAEKYHRRLGSRPTGEQVTFYVGEEMVAEFPEATVTAIIKLASA